MSEGIHGAVGHPRKETPTVYIYQQEFCKSSLSIPKTTMDSEAQKPQPFVEDRFREAATHVHLF